MRNQEFISFIENLALVKDVELKSKLIQDELSNLNKLLKAEEDPRSTSRLDKITLMTKYLEMETFKNVLSFRLSILESGFQKK